ncbi:MAG: hypothetical protein WBH60_03895 [Fervidobacterium sp.]
MKNEIRRYLGIEICPVFDCTYIKRGGCEAGALSATIAHFEVKKIDLRRNAYIDAVNLA